MAYNAYMTHATDRNDKSATGDDFLDEAEKWYSGLSLEAQESAIKPCKDESHNQYIVRLYMRFLAGIGIEATKEATDKEFDWTTIDAKSGLSPSQIWEIYGIIRDQSMSDYHAEQLKEKYRRVNRKRGLICGN